MSRGALGKNNWALFLMLLAGIMLGGFIGNAAAGVSGLSWLNYGQSFGFASPIVLDLGILVITFGLSIKITIASIIGVLIAIIIYRLIYVPASDIRKKPRAGVFPCPRLFAYV